MWQRMKFCESLLTPSELEGPGNLSSEAELKQKCGVDKPSESFCGDADKRRKIYYWGMLWEGEKNME